MSETAPVPPQPSASGESTEGVVELSADTKDIPVAAVDANIQQSLMQPDEVREPHEIINEAHEQESASKSQSVSSSATTVIVVAVFIALLLLGVGVLAIISTPAAS